MNENKNIIMDYTIRIERESDYDSIYNVIKIAFLTAKVSDGDEQDFAVNLRNSENYIPELALVAENVSSDIIGHIMFTKMYIKDSNQDAVPALLLAPISVLIEYRGKSVGGSLINEGFRIAREMGYESVFLCGDPDYYHKFGFATASDFGIKHTSDLEDKYVMCCELADGSLKDINGIIDVI